jgi:8-oxo-dGTP pyrophosphatase MutT (NUDIX family)
VQALAETLRGSLLSPRPDPRLPRGAPAAVAVPLLDLEHPALLFTRRTDEVRHHKGEISFPGGAMQPEDPDLLATALRETEEELGLPGSVVEVLGALPLLETFVSGFVVVPFVVRLPERPELRPNPREVAEVLELDLAGLAAAERLVERRWRGTSFQTFVYEVDGYVVWGATGRILHELLESLRREGWTWPRT